MSRVNYVISALILIGIATYVLRETPFWEKFETYDKSELVAPIYSADFPELRDHPRLLITKDTVSAIRLKLSKPDYAEDLAILRKSENPTDQAFLYAIWQDEAAGANAKRALLEGNIPRWGGLEKQIQIVQAALMFDWLYPLLSPDERARAVRIVKSRLSERAKNIGDSKIQYYFNDVWARGAAFIPIVALALSGDDEWADQVINMAYKYPSKVFSPYRGGAIDVLNTLSLDSGGGHQAGIKTGPGTGYESMFLIGASLFILSWESATGEDLQTNTNFFELYPEYITHSYLHVMPLGERAKQTLEYITGIGSAKSAALAKWLLEEYGRARYARVLRLISGDISRPKAKPPEDLKLPTATYLPGADLVTSRTGWNKSDIAVFMFARHWDTSRYEPDSGTIGIYKGGRPLLVRGIDGKTNYSVTNSSGMWIWEQGEMAGSLGQGNTYSRKLKNLDEDTDRATSAIQVLMKSNTEYRPETLTNFIVGKDGVKATTSYHQLLRHRGVKKAERTITHNQARVTLVDELIVPKGTRSAWSLRLPEEPKVDGNIITTSDLKITLISPDSRIYWSGGAGKELIGPTGKWHGNKKHGFVPGYSEVPSKRRQYGAGYLFAEPLEKSKQYRFEALIEIR